MPKSKRRKGNSLLREKKAKLKNGENGAETPAEDGLNVLENRKSTGDNPKSENGDNTSEKSNASVDVEIIDRQIQNGDDPPIPAASHNRNDENMNENMGYAIIEGLKKQKLFDRIRYSEDAVSALPNRSWAIHCTELPVKRIVVSEMAMLNADGTGMKPFYIKQIIIDDKLNFEIFLISARTVLKDKPSVIRSMEDFESLLDHVHDIKLCSGGPDYQKYSHISPECAYKDPTNKWRHNLCTLEVNNCDTCESCQSLDGILKRHAQRVKPAVKHKNIITMVTRKRPGQSKDT